MKFVYFFLVVLAIPSCGGLDPGTLPEVTAVHGTIRYEGGSASWPDTVQEVRVVLFDQQPLAPDSVLSAILNARASYSDTLPRFSDSCTYNIVISQPPHTYRYVVVAARVGPNFIKDWIMLSLYHTPDNPLIPETLVVDEGAEVQVDFVVDFSILPPQPFE